MSKAGLVSSEQRNLIVRHKPAFLISIPVRNGSRWTCAECGWSASTHSTRLSEHRINLNAMLSMDQGDDAYIFTRSRTHCTRLPCTVVTMPAKL